MNYANLVTNRTARLPGDLALPPTEAPKPKRNKYNAVKVKADGITFDSKMEYARYLELRLLEKAGKISGLVVHPEYLLQQAVQDGTRVIRPIIYEADFAYTEDYPNEHGIMLSRRVCEDTKGHETEAFKVKAKMFRAAFPQIDFRILRKVTK
jgi:hypothetical protein